MTFDEALVWLLRLHAAWWLLLVVVEAVRPSAWFVPARDPVRERREHEERERQPSA